MKFLIKEGKFMHLNAVKKQSLPVYWLFSFFYWEILAHAGMYDQFQGSFRYAL